MKLLILAPDEIKVAENRHRKTFSTKLLAELRSSIKSVGLIQPIVVRNGCELVAGERRLRACKEILAAGNKITCGTLNISGIPCFDIASLPSEQAEELELDENIRRVDLTWQERAAATQRLHNLRRKKDPKWTLAQTASETRSGGGASHTHNRILLAGHLDDPDIAKAENETQAVKIMLKKIEDEFTAVIGTRAVSNPNMTLRHIDAIAGMKELPAGSVNVILTDPPYGINVGSYGINREATVKHSYDDTNQTWGGLMELFFIEAVRVGTPDVHLYTFFDFSMWRLLTAHAHTNGWTVWPRPLIWSKNIAISGDILRGPQRSYECILYAYRGDRPLLTIDRDVLFYSTVQNKRHAAEKPIDLYKNLLRRSASVGDTVLDPFCGSGTIFAAAKQLNLKAIGFDSDPSAVGLAKEII